MLVVRATARPDLCNSRLAPSMPNARARRNSLQAKAQVEDRNGSRRELLTASVVLPSLFMTARRKQPACEELVVSQMSHGIMFTPSAKVYAAIVPVLYPVLLCSVRLLPCHGSSIIYLMDFQAFKLKRRQRWRMTMKCTSMIRRGALKSSRMMSPLF